MKSEAAPAGRARKARAAKAASAIHQKKLQSPAPPISVNTSRQIGRMRPAFAESIGRSGR